jgi:outer membrane biosynthesis protein TonB
MARFQATGQSLGALAATLLLTSTSTLPALAALPRMQTGQASATLASEGAPLLAESNNDDKKNKKKQKQDQPSNKSQKNSQQQHSQPTKNSTQQHQSQPGKKSQQQHSQPTKNTQKQNSQPNTKQHSSTSKDKEQNKNKISDKQREKIYEEGRHDGLKKGREKGYDKGYDAGKQKGKDKGYDKGYDKGFDDGKQKGKDKAYRNAKRQEWKSWDSKQWKYYNNSRRNIWVRPVSYNRPWGGYPMWAQSPNWGYNRPWGGGWYNSGYSNWSWWGGQALGCGINALTTALIVNNAVNNAIRDRQTTVVVPNSSMKLYYGSVEARDRTEVTFVAANGNYTYEMEADCEDGLLNGEVPTSLSEAELVNAACQVAFGSI